MSSAEFVQPILTILKFTCYIVLAFYVLKVLFFIVYGKKTNNDNSPDKTDNNNSHRLREALAAAYTCVAAYFIFYSTDAILPFIQNILETANLVAKPSTTINIILIVSAGLVCVAFLCNFSRSLWMLKSLDHAVFEAVPEWEKLSEEIFPKRSLEFLTRTTAAVLFIFIEFELKKLANSSQKDNVGLLASGHDPYNYLTNAGLYGVFLYICLIAWWFCGLWIAKKQMPKRLLIFYIAGLVNSGFIYIYSGKTLDEESAATMLLIIIIMAIGSLYMIYIVLSDLIPMLWLKTVKPGYDILRLRLYPKTSRVS